MFSLKLLLDLLAVLHRRDVEDEVSQPLVVLVDMVLKNIHAFRTPL